MFKTHDAEGKLRKRTLTSNILFPNGEMIFFLYHRDHTVGITNGQLVTTAADQEGQAGALPERTTLHGNFTPVSDLLDLLQKTGRRKDCHSSLCHGGWYEKGPPAQSPRLTLQWLRSRRGRLGAFAYAQRHNPNSVRLKAYGCRRIQEHRDKRFSVQQFWSYSFSKSHFQRTAWHTRRVHRPQCA